MQPLATPFRRPSSLKRQSPAAFSGPRGACPPAVASDRNDRTPSAQGFPPTFVESRRKTRTRLLASGFFDFSAKTRKTVFSGFHSKPGKRPRRETLFPTFAKYYKDHRGGHATPDYHTRPYVHLQQYGTVEPAVLCRYTVRVWCREWAYPLLSETRI